VAPAGDPHGDPAADPADRELTALQAGIAGEVVRPGSPGYDAVRRPAVGRFRHVRPRAVVRCADPEDVAATLAAARLLRLPVAVRGGGHCFAGGSSTSGVLVDLSPMNAVDLGGGLATIGAGTRLGSGYDALAAHGVTLPAGCGPGVGIAGLTLGGGFGQLGRLHGLTCDRLLGAQVVLGDGRIVDCDAHREPDLFWALRGGGGWGAGAGWVVTALRFDPVPAPQTTTFRLSWAATDATAVVAAWPRWAPAAPPELSAGLRLIAPAEPDEAVQVHVEGTLVGGDPAPLLGRLVATVGAEPITVATRQGSYRDAKRALAGLGGDGGDAAGVRCSRSEFFRRPIPHTAVAALVATVVAQRVPGQAHEVSATPWGGAYNRAAPDATAFPHRGEAYLLQNTILVPHRHAAAARRRLARSWSTIGRWGSGRGYANFPDPDRPVPARTYYGGNLERLRRVRARYAATSRTRPASGPGAHPVRLSPSITESRGREAGAIGTAAGDAAAGQDPGQRPSPVRPPPASPG
jgi:FAD/FMN-containing dehydrogenase